MCQIYFKFILMTGKFFLKKIYVFIVFIKYLNILQHTVDNCVQLFLSNVYFVLNMFGKENRLWIWCQNKICWCTKEFTSYAIDCIVRSKNTTNKNVFIMDIIHNKWTICRWYFSSVIDILNFIAKEDVTIVYAFQNLEGTYNIIIQLVICILLVLGKDKFLLCCYM